MSTPNPFQNKPWFLRVCSISHLKTLGEKEELLITSNSSFSLSVFYSIVELSAIFIKSKIVVCKLLSLEESKICCFGKDLSIFHKHTVAIVATDD